MPEMMVHGLEELDRDLRRLPRKVQGQNARKATRAGATVIRRKAKQNAPRDQGDLRKGVVLRTVRGGRNEIRVVVGILKTVFYGMYAEFGTKSQRKRPWLRPAFEETKDEAARAVIDRLWLLIRKKK